MDMDSNQTLVSSLVIQIQSTNLFNTNISIISKVNNLCNANCHCASRAKVGLGELQLDKKVLTEFHICMQLKKSPVTQEVV